MPILNNVEARIAMIEHFEVNFMQNGLDVRGDKKDIPQWPYANQSKNDWTVSQWKGKFSQIYPGYDVVVLDGSGNQVVAGQTKLGTVRDTYNN